MESARKLKEHYFFTEEDVKNLLHLKPLMEKVKAGASVEFYRFVKSFDETRDYMPDDDTLKKHRFFFQQWFMSLFEGVYDHHYFVNLERIGRTHVRIGLKGHFVNAAMNVIRTVIREAILSEYRDPDEQEEYSNSAQKILDISLDVMTSSYREEELKKVFLSYKLDDLLIRFAERFTYGLNVILVISLMGISAFVIYLFGIDVFNLFSTDPAHKGKAILGALGTLLIIWVMIELMENEIRQLKGGKFRIQIFLGVVLIALLREVLITSLSHEALELQALILGGILVLGLVYWLVSKAESRQPPSH